MRARKKQRERTAGSQEVKHIVNRRGSRKDFTERTNKVGIVDRLHSYRQHKRLLKVITLVEVSGKSFYFT